MANAFSGFSDTPDQSDFLQNLGQLLMLMQGMSQNKPLESLNAMNQMKLTSAKLKEYQAQHRAAQQQAAFRTQASGMFSGGLRPGEQGPPAPFDVNQFMALAAQDPEAMKLLTPQSIQLMQQGGRIQDFGGLQAQTAMSQAQGLQNFPGPPPGYSQELSGTPEGVKFTRKQPTSLAEMETGAIRETAKTPQEQLGMVTEAKRPPISEENLLQTLDKKIARVQDIDKMLIGTGGGDPLKQAIMVQFGPAQGLEKLKLKIERNLLAADAQETENRRAEIANRQGFPDEQPRRLFSSPILGREQLIEGAGREFLANFGIEWKEKAPKPYIPPEVRAKMEEFLTQELAGFE